MPAARSTVRSVLFGSIWYSRGANELLTAPEARSAGVRPGPAISNMMAGPETPRASRFSATTRSGSPAARESTNALAPSRPCSSASVNSTPRSLRGCGPARNARTVSSSAATLLPLSAAPGPVGTES